MSKSFDILLVEDNEADAFLMQEAFAESRYRINLSTVGDGVEAVEFLRRNGRFAEAPRPDLIMLDLNMPKKDGRQVLSEIKNDDDLKVIPVIILTTSESEADVALSYSSHASCYITKPMGLEEMYRIIRSIEDYWFSVVRLPQK
ncbi:response regulator [Geobacter sp. DSM 9736]|uniref:response regulator n=1 Tax=Geobacter sp. DSM 9736 TaxID=1277350 RepID=UPI000B50E81E|nr:response regulator [Geobacter sp. DSM 9736]SNB44909.1 Response regulator receiver domain-containing protein [Geobacter sp. DSM 9736]